MEDTKILLQETISSIANFLYSNQIILQKIKLPQCQNDFFSVTEKVFNVPLKITWEFKCAAGRWYYKSGLGGWSSVPTGQPFRLPLPGPIFKKEIPGAVESRSAIVGKFRFYIGYSDFFIRLLKYIDYKVRNAFVVRKLFSTGATPLAKELAEQGGVTFMAATDEQGCMELICVDKGGIIDFKLDGEAETLPPQTPEYGAEYALYVFYWMWKQTGGMQWLTAAKSAADFVVNNIKPHACVSFDSYEFKILPIACFLDAVSKNGDANLFPVAQLTDCLSDAWIFYDPINVQAMRLANLAMLEHLGVACSAKKYRHCLRLVEKNQTEQGLIMDNRGGSKIHNADVTYHQFALACLAFAARYKQDDRLLQLVSKGLHFSRSVALPNGHVSYYGRGANNIYHLASYAFVESQARDKDILAIKKVLLLLKPFLTPQDGLPAALNNYAAVRMGWNHCEVPYNGQAAFFFCNTYDALQDSLPDVNLVATKQGDVQFFDQCVLKNETFNVAISRGSDLQEWSGGAHVVGMGGLAAITLRGLHITLANEFSIVDERWTGDLPHGLKRKKMNQDYSGRLTLINQQSAQLTLPEVTAQYRIDGNVLTVEYTLKQPVHFFINLGAISFNSAVVKSYKLNGSKCFLSLTNGMDVIFAVDTPSEVYIESQTINSNPFGKGLLFVIKPPLTPSPFTTVRWRLYPAV